MTVKTKKEDKNNSIIPMILVVIFFGAFSIPILIPFIKDISYISDFKEFIDLFVQAGMLLMFALFFGAMDLYLISFFFRSPKKYLAVLKSKEAEDYNGKIITSMTFLIKNKSEKDRNPYSEYKCYTDGENNLILNSEYIIGIKELTYTMKTVDEINNYSEKEIVYSKSQKDNVSFGAKLPIYGILLIFGIPFILVIWKLVFDIKDNNTKNLVADIIALIFLGLFVFSALYILIQVDREEDIEDDKDVENKDDEKDE